MIRHLLNIIMSLLILVSTTGFTVSKHYCGDNLVSVAVNAEASTCCGDMCSADCCHNETHHYQLKKYFLVSGAETQTSSNDPHIFFPHVNATVLNICHIEKKGVFSYTGNPPPLDTTKFLAFIQTYRF